jgi:hypothetical protein
MVWLLLNDLNNAPHLVQVIQSQLLIDLLHGQVLSELMPSNETIGLLLLLLFISG